MSLRSLLDVSLSAGDGTKGPVADEVKLNFEDASEAHRDHVWASRNLE